ncbi:MAG: hypothetical protein HDR88_14900 [Bacteroides sp.]|nr:hypothetical protein [Bacteroides sp.]
MTHEELSKKIADLVEEYIENFDRFDSNPQIRVNPALDRVTLVNGSDMLEEIEDSDEAVEDAAAADGAETEDASDYQASQNPDFYPVKKLLKTEGSGKTVPDKTAIKKIADQY